MSLRSFTERTSLLLEEIQYLQIMVDDYEDFCSELMRFTVTNTDYFALSLIKRTNPQLDLNYERLQSASDLMGLEPFHFIFGTINEKFYHTDVWTTAYPEAKLPGEYKTSAKIAREEGHNLFFCNFDLDTYLNDTEIPYYKDCPELRESVNQFFTGA